MGLFERLVPLPLLANQSGTINGYVGTTSKSAVAVRASAYVAQGSAAQRSVNSTSANDTSAGTGAQQVTITYYDNSMAGPFTEVVTLNGTTAVNTVGTNIRYIEKLQVTQVGTGGSNVGTIQLWTTTAGGGSVFASIIAGDNQTFWAAHYVSASRTCYVVGFRAALTVGTGGATLQTTGDPNATNLPYTNLTGTLRHGVETNLLDWDPWLVVPGPNLIIVNERPDNAIAQTAYASFDFVEF